jgi:hypothetical protein
MVTVCAWCQRFLGLKPSSEPTVSHGICESCRSRQEWGEDVPTLIVGKSRAHMVPVLSEILRGAPEIRVVIDRRSRDRRSTQRRSAGLYDRRRGPDRRQGTELVVH